MALNQELRRDAGTCLALVAIALVLYLFRIGEPPRYIYDEAYHAYTAEQLVKGDRTAYWWDGPLEGRVAPNGQRVFTTWTHPPFSRDLMQIGIRLFGSHALGWRVMSAVFGALGAALLFLLGKRLFGYTVGLCGAGLLLLDGLWFVQSRTAMLDIFLAVFLLTAYYFFGRYLETDSDTRGRYLCAVGIALGLALATKWSAVYSWAALLIWAFCRELKLLSRNNQLGVAAGAFLAVPLIIYLAAYAQFFFMGYSLADWIELQGMMFHYHTTLQEGHAWASSWWSWPLVLRPVWYYSSAGDSNQIAQTFAMGNPAIWWCFLPACMAVAWKWKQHRYDWRFGLVLLGFLGNWLPWSLSPRVAFIYHLLPSVPFGCMAIALVLGALMRRGRKDVAWVYLGIALLTFQYFYPLLSAQPVSPEFTQGHYWLSTWDPEKTP